MMNAALQEYLNTVQTVDEIADDYKARRAAIITALTTDLEEFYQQCDPALHEKCLLGYPDEKWEVDLPIEEVPTDFPEPTVGLNVLRDELQEKDWLRLVAAHSDAWLFGTAFYLAARAGLDHAQRMELFDKMNDLPTVLEVVASAKKPHKEKSRGGNYKSNKPRFDAEPSDEDNDEDEETLCGACNKAHASDDLSICCDMCEKWFHGECIASTSAREHIKQYKCASCSGKDGAS